jgi:hypothetical protein
MALILVPSLGDFAWQDFGFGPGIGIERGNILSEPKILNLGFLKQPQITQLPSYPTTNS